MRWRRAGILANLVHNERIKLMAGALDKTGIAIGVAGAITPLINAVGAGQLPTVRGSIAGLVLLIVGTGLHILGLGVLGRLRDV